MSRIVHCCKLKLDAEGLDTPPFPGELGHRVYQQVSKKAWNMWLSHQTMLINEYRLRSIDPEARTFLKGEMEKYFFGEGSDKPSGFTPENLEAN